MIQVLGFLSNHEKLLALCSMINGVSQMIKLTPLTLFKQSESALRRKKGTRFISKLVMFYRLVNLEGQASNYVLSAILSLAELKCIVA